MKKLICTDAVAVTKKTIPGVVTDQDVNSLLIKLAVGGTGYTTEALESIELMAFLKKEQGNNVQVIKPTDLLSLAMVGDHDGGFSAENRGDSNGNLYILVDLESISVRGTDELQVSLKFPAHATITYTVSVWAITTSSKDEKIKTITISPGIGSNVTFENVARMFIFDPTIGDISINSEIDGQRIETAEAVCALSNTVGKVDIETPVGILFYDVTGFGQKVIVSLALGAKLLVEQYDIDPDRLADRQGESEERLEAYFERIRMNNESKYNWIRLFE